MISVSFNDKKFINDMMNITKYAEGFLEGIELGKKNFLNNFGSKVIAAMAEFIDSNARVSPAMLQHMYEWNQSGSPEARLFDLNYIVSGTGLSVSSSFRQSTAIQSGSKVPFHNKASIMENGIPVRIAPAPGKVLRFFDGGNEIFTKKPVMVQNPGGDLAKGGFENTVDMFVTRYLSQSFLVTSGIKDYLDNAKPFKDGMATAKTGGKSHGVKIGYTWISKAGL